MRQKTQLELTLRAGARGEARSAGAEGTEARAATTEVESRAAGWAVDGSDCRARQSEEGAGAS